MIGSFIVAAAYVLYFVGVAGGASTSVLMQSGAPTAFSNIFGNVGGKLLQVCIVISCLGTLNGLMVAASRGMYAIAARNQGPKPKMFRQIDASTNMVSNSAVYGLLMCCIWMVYFYGANMAGYVEGAPLNPVPGRTTWFGPFCFDSSELPNITIYAMYIPMFIIFMSKSKELNGFKRFVMPALAVAGSCFMVYAAFAAYGTTVLYYLVVYAVIMVIGNFFYRPAKK